MRNMLLLVTCLCLAGATPLAAYAQASTPTPTPAPTTAAPAPTTPAPALTTAIPLLPGADTPITIKVSDLKEPGWLMFYPDQPFGEGRGNDTTPYATRSAVFTLAGMQYLIAYKLVSPGSSGLHTDVPSNMYGGPDSQYSVNIPLPVTENSTLNICLLDLKSFGSLNDLAPYSRAWLDDLNVRRGTDPEGLKVWENSAEQSLLMQKLQVIQNAIRQFLEDTGVYPARLEDLVATTAPTVGAGGAAIPTGAYKGPYLEPKGGINNTGLPANPFAKAGDTDVTHHWRYTPQNGQITSAVTIELLIK